MDIQWKIDNSDIQRVVSFVEQNQGKLTAKRMARNVQKQKISIGKDTVIKKMLASLLASKHDFTRDSDVGQFLKVKPFLLTYDFLSKATMVEFVMASVLKENGLERYAQRVPAFFAHNFSYLEGTDWILLDKLHICLKKEMSRLDERELADSIDKVFKGFGSKEARYFLQSLGLTKYEIPIDSALIGWLENFGFPVKITPTALQDKEFYHFISDGIQLLCHYAGIYPCILNAAVLSEQK